MTAQNIMDSMKFSAQVAPVQSDLFTPSHVLYKCKIVNNGKQYTFDYQCNPTYKAPNIEDCLYCLFSDASCVDCVADVDDFLRELGYTDSLESIRKGEKAFKACKHTAKALARIFTTEEMEVLSAHFENY